MMYSFILFLLCLNSELFQTKIVYNKNPTPLFDIPGRPTSTEVFSSELLSCDSTVLEITSNLVCFVDKKCTDCFTLVRQQDNTFGLSNELVANILQSTLSNESQQ
jgi:hypothetical protein